MTPEDTVKFVGDEVHKFVDSMERQGADRSHTLLIMMNAAIRLLMRSGVKAKDMKRMLRDSLDVARKG